MSEALLEVKDLKTYLFLRRGVVKAVDGISFSVYPGQSIGIVGESGSGKSMAVSSILRLLPQPAGRTVEGSILFKGEDLLKKDSKSMCKIRGKEISVIMQDPMNSLNPVYTIGNQLKETIRFHTECRARAKLQERAASALRSVMIPAPETRLAAYPHELSGGMRQRVVGSIALCCEPSLLIADEPTTALDVTIQAQYLELLKKIQSEMGVAMIFITHDLGIVARMCEYVCVMYLGKMVEKAPAIELWRNPRHKYTIALLKSIPSVNKKADRLYAIEGTVPSSLNIPKGCRFCTRCKFADDRCKAEEPPEMEIGDNHFVSCWKAKEA